MKKPNLLWGVRLLFLAMLFGLMLPNAMAVSRDLTIAPKDIRTEKYYRDSPVCICEVALLDGGKWVLSEPFQDSNISQKILFGENGGKYAGQIYDYVMDNDLLYAVDYTDKQGKAVFSALDEGLYLVFSPDELFAPFLVELTESLLCEPKADPGKPEPRALGFARCSRLWRQALDPLHLRILPQGWSLGGHRKGAALFLKKKVKKLFRLPDAGR